MGAFFLDSSALVKGYIKETGTHGLGTRPD